MTSKVIKEPLVHLRQSGLTGGLNYDSSKHLPNISRYLQQHLEVLKLLMAVLAVDTIGHVPISSKGNRWALTAICPNTSYVFTVSMKEKSAENVVQAYLLGILADKGGSVTILSDNGTEFKKGVK